MQGQVKVRRALSQCHVEDIALLITDYFLSAITYYQGLMLWVYVQKSQSRLPDPQERYSARRHTSTSNSMQIQGYQNSTVFKHNMCLISEAIVKQQGLPIDICCSLFWSRRHSRRERAALREREGFEHEGSGSGLERRKGTKCHPVRVSLFFVGGGGFLALSWSLRFSVTALSF